jgi:hypothetical protein
MNRITDKHLDALCARLNKLTRSPETKYTRHERIKPEVIDGKPGQKNIFWLSANVGHYHISHAYGGVCLHRMSNESGGVTTPLTYGHVPKRELYNAMLAYIAGFEAALCTETSVNEETSK